MEAATDIGLDYSGLSHEITNEYRNRALRGNTFFKIVKPLDMDNLERIITMNELTDLSGAKKIIAAGGHPGGEA